MAEVAGLDRARSGVVPAALVWPELEYDLNNSHTCSLPQRNGHCFSCRDQSFFAILNSRVNVNVGRPFCELEICVHCIEHRA